MCGAQGFLYHPCSGVWSVCVLYLPSNYQFPGGLVFALIPDSIFQDGSIVGRDSGVAHFVASRVFCRFVVADLQIVE